MKPKEDDYETCAETYATLRLYHRTHAPDSVTTILGLAPTKTQKIGDTYQGSNQTRTIKLNGWFLESEKEVASFDLEKHIQHIVGLLQGKEDALHDLTKQGWRMDLACMWDSAYAHGGPTFSPKLMSTLGNLGLELWLDIYFRGSYDLLRREKEAFGGR